MGSFKYEYKGVFINGNGKQYQFGIQKFDDGKYFKNMKWDTDNQHNSVNVLSSTFMSIQKATPSIISIAKKSDNRIDRLLEKAKAVEGADFSTLVVIFTAYLNGGFLARQKLELLNIDLINKGKFRVKGIGNLSVYSFQADNAVHTVISEDEYYNSLGD